ncbi:tetratricopeptide repeat protein [Hymenobacter psoromatis]|uniref:tetratricopeptide repeat protein n=1 Tax=Hymenobacter psoromatis TaxID=1484116 RepID=UPI001CC10D45
MDSFPPLPPERLPQRGNIEERQVRITELEDRYAHLLLDNSDKKRLLKDKANIQKLLAEEYTEAFAYDKAVEAYKKAIALQKILLANNEIQGELLFNLAMVYHRNQQFDNSLALFQNCKLISTEENYGVIYHGIGVVYAEQRSWSLALLNYRQALSWNKKVGKLQGLGTTHFQIGILYVEQEEWVLALYHYRKSITLDQESGNEYMRGSTYSQIGKVYAKQYQWGLALENFKQAVLWKQEHGSEFSVGITYYQIGQAYQEQGESNLALKAYQDALEWDTKTGNDIQLGTICFQIGTVYELQEKFSEAQEWYEKAMINLARYDHPAHPIAAAALGRVWEAQD